MRPYGRIFFPWFLLGILQPHLDCGRGLRPLSFAAIGTGAKGRKCMEKRTSEVFKKWMTCSVSVYEKGLAQGTAEDRVTAVNNELGRTSLTKGVTVFDNQGMVVYDLKSLLAHVKAIKAFLDKGKWLDKRNKYGIGSFVPFVEWLLKNSKLKTYDLLVAYFNNPNLDQAIPYGNLFKKWLVKK